MSEPSRKTSSIGIASANAATVRGAGGAFLVNVVGVALGFLLQVLLARTLKLHEFGLYAYATTWVAILTVVCSAGLDSTALRFVSASLARKSFGEIRGFLMHGRARTTLYATLAGLGLGVGALTFATSPGTASVLISAGLLLPLSTLIAFHGAVLQALNRAVLSQAVQVVLRTCVLLVLLGAWHFLSQRELNAKVAMALNISGAAIALTVLLMVVHRSMPRGGVFAAGSNLAPWRSTSNVLFAISAFQLVLSQVDILVVGFLMEKSDVGLYSVASRNATLVTFAITTVNGYLAPRIAFLYEAGDRAMLQRTVTLIARGVFLYTLAVAGVLVVFGEWILSLFGEEYVSMYGILVTLIVGQVVIGACGSVGFLLTMTRHERPALNVIAASAAMALALNILLIPAYGLAGAAVATVCAITFRSIALSVLVAQRLRINPTPFAL